MATQSPAIKDGSTVVPPEQEDSCTPGKDKNAIEVHLEIHVDPELVADFPLDVAHEFNVIPLTRIQGRFIVAASDQLTSQQVEALGRRLDGEVEVIFSRIPNLPSLIEALRGRRQAKRKIGEILTEDHAISENQLTRALEKQKSDPRKLGQILVDLGLVSKEELRQSLEKQARHNNPSLDPYLFVNPKVVAMVPESVARHYEILPLERTQGSLLLLCSRYLDADALEEIKSITGLDPKPLLTDPEDLKTAVEKSYGRRKTAETRKLRIGDILHGEGLITEEQLRICLEQQKHSRLRLGEIIVELGYASVEAVYTCLANKLDLEYRSFDVTELDLELTQLIPQKFAERHGVLPLAVESNTLVVAMSEPNDLNVRDSLEAMAGQRGYQLKAVLSSPASVTRGLAYTYNPKGAVGRKLK